MEKKEYHKNYYAENKQKITDRMLEKVECDVCKKHVTRCNLPKHQRTVKCKKHTERKQTDANAAKIDSLLALVQQLIGNKKENDD